MKKRVLSWGTFMCDIIAAGLDEVAEPGIIRYLEQGIKLRLGGHPVDVVIDLARIGMDQRQIAFVSTIGNDIFGDFLMRELAAYQFESFVERVDGGTGKVLILSVRDRDRLAHLDLGACMHMSLGYLKGVLESTTPDVFTMRPGYTSLDAEMGSMLKELRKGALQDSFVLLDLCAPYKKPWSYYLSLLPYVDAVHGNSKELVRACGVSTFAEATETMLALGTSGVLLTKEDAGAEVITPRLRVSQPAFEIQAVEPSGCGDAFCAGVVYALLKQGRRLGEMDGDDLAEVLLWGQALGAAAATEVGCVNGVSEQRVRGLLESQGRTLLSHTTILPAGQAARA